ncbi:MAG: LysM peptidoglycan-binding domain-containing protein [Chloroflexi bacterium]|nr:LysM peptidoglycan-binding domain-containing protein [Chloroflexota bacterium]
MKQMATPAGRQMRTGPFEGERDWERPRRFEAYPTLRTRVGMPGLPRLGRLPPVAVGGIALVLAAAILFALPGLFAGGPGGGGASSPTPPTSARPTVTPSPSTPVPATPQVYIVKRGDTFSGIASRFNLTLDELKAANPQITNINALRVGDRINIPDPFASPSAGASDIPSPTASATQ